MDSLQPLKFNNDDKLAIVSERGLGGALIYMVLANNLVKTGYNVSFFHSGLHELNDWFPNTNIFPFPEKSKLEETYAKYNKVIIVSNSVDRDAIIAIKNTQICTFNKRHFRQENMLNSVMAGCRSLFRIPEPIKKNGITIASNLTSRKYKNRVIIHPLSVSHDKNWTAKRFAKFSNLLEKHDYEPVYIISKYEREQWDKLLPGSTYPTFTNLSELASFIYESGWMVGNDSGIGHLASCLGVPTLTLGKPFGRSYFWQPGWAPGKLVTPNIRLPRKLNHLWKYLLSVNKVWREFHELVANFKY